MKPPLSQYPPLSSFLTTNHADDKQAGPLGLPDPLPFENGRGGGTTQEMPVVLSGIEASRQTVQRYRRHYTEEEKSILVARARAGDPQARDTILLAVYGFSSWFASKMTLAYSWASARIEYDDLVQMGVLAATETFDKGIEMPDPLAYLCKVARYAIGQFCYQYASPIRTPSHTHKERAAIVPKIVVSLDAPIGDGSRTLGETLREPEREEALPRDYSELYKAIQALPERDREVIERHYGLFQQAPEALYAIEKATKYPRVRNIRERACTKLARFLQGKARTYHRAVPPGLPEGSMLLVRFAECYGLVARTLIYQARGGRINVTIIDRGGRPEYWLTPDQQEELRRQRFGVPEAMDRPSFPDKDEEWEDRAELPPVEVLV